MNYWTVAASLATAFGTLVLAIATFSAIRSANRTAQTAERSLQAGLRPLIISSRLTDAPLKVMFVDGKMVAVPGGCAWVQKENGVIYLVASLRNVGPGIGIVHGWCLYPDRVLGATAPDQGQFRLQGRDLYLAPGDVGFWQGALRDAEDPQHGPVGDAITAGTPITVDVMYGDYEGGQRVITRFSMIPRSGHDTWLLSVGRHWHIDRPEPRNHESWTQP